MKGFKSVVVTMALLCAACAGNGLKTVHINMAGTPFNIEIANTPETKEKGLMERRSLAPNAGMLFVYDYDKKMSFWMKNTSIPLSIAYISSEGVIKEIYDMEPFNLVPVLSKHSVRYALELNKGKFDELGIVPGMKIFDPAVMLKDGH